MFGHIAMQNTARIDLHRDEDVQHSKAGGHAGEEIAGYDGFGMIANEGAPALACGAAGMARVEILSHGSRRNYDAELELQFVCDSLFAPGWILAVQIKNEFSKVPGQRRPATLAGFPAPEYTKRLPVPSDKGLGLDDHETRAPIEESSESEERHSDRPRCPARLNVAFSK